MNRCLSSAEDSKLPPHLLRTLRGLQPWRARLKALGDCRMPQPTPVPLWWVPAAELRPAAALQLRAAHGRPRASRLLAPEAWPRTLLEEAFGVRVRWACEAGDGDGDGGEGGDGEDGEAEAGCGAAAARDAAGAAAAAGVVVAGGGVAVAAAPVLGGRLCGLLDSLGSGGAGQLFAVLQQPTTLLWWSFVASGGGGGGGGDGGGGNGGDGGGGDGGDGGDGGEGGDEGDGSEALAAFEAWLESQPDNPLVRALNGCGDAALAPPHLVTPDEAGAQAGGDTGAPFSSSWSSLWRPLLADSHLESAKQLLEERVLLGTASSTNRTQRSLQLFSAFFGWPRLNAPPPARDGAAGGAVGSALLEASAPEIPPLLRAAARRKVGLDERLYPNLNPNPTLTLTLTPQPYPNLKTLTP